MRSEQAGAADAPTTEPRAASSAVPMPSGVERIVAGNASPMTANGTNSYVVRSRPGARVAVIDPGPDEPGHIAALSAAMAGAAAPLILVTHTHRDHSAGAARLKALTGGTVLAAGPHRLSRPVLSDESGRTFGADLDFVPDRTLADGEAVDLGGFRLEAVATPGHTANHLCFAWPERRILFSGDHVMGWSTTVVAPPDGSMGDYMASLDRLLARPETLYLPGHGDPISDVQAYLRGLKNHRRLRERAIARRLRAGDTDTQAIARAVYPGLSAALRGAAALSTLAHLEDLVRRGLAEADGAGRSAAYRLTPAGRLASAASFDDATAAEDAAEPGDR